MGSTTRCVTHPKAEALCGNRDLALAREDLLPAPLTGRGVTYAGRARHPAGPARGPGRDTCWSRATRGPDAGESIAERQRPTTDPIVGTCHRSHLDVCLAAGPWIAAGAKPRRRGGNETERTSRGVVHAGHPVAHVVAPNVLQFSCAPRARLLELLVRRQRQGFRPACSSRSATHTLIMDCRVTPSRLA
jgi:hypothetical protein